MVNIKNNATHSGWNQLKLFFFQAKREVCIDLRSARWKRGLCWMCFAIWVLALTLYLTVFHPISPQLDIFYPKCTGEAFSVEVQDLWAISDFFEITLAFGPLSFTEAKVIDVVWDIVSYCVAHLSLTLC